VQKDYLKVVTQVCPGGVARRPLGYEDGCDFRVPPALEAVAVPQHLAEAQAELFFFLVVVGDALDLGNEGGVAFLPGQVEVRFVRQTGPGRQPCLAEDSRELVLGIGMPAQAPRSTRAGSVVKGCLARAAAPTFADL
jgi:hypothetical protein